MKIAGATASDVRPFTINREAGDKAKGFRLQKLRAARLMLEMAESRPCAFFYAAVEVVEDVCLIASDQHCTHTHIEEDKNFDASVRFTLFSEPVLNTLVSFFDVFTNQWKDSTSVVLGFYTTASIGKEKKDILDDGTKLTLPDKPILEILSSKVNDDIANLVKQVLIEEYARQYKNKVSKGHLQTLTQCSTEQFKKFLSSISWFFSSEDEVRLKESVLQLIEKSKYHNYKVANKEDIILALILEAFDERQGLADYASRFMTLSDLKLAFKHAESEMSSQAVDPVWALVEKIESEVNDKRNLEEKIRAVVPNYPAAKIRQLARIACASKQEQLAGNKSFLALKYRSYEACEGVLCDAQYAQPVTALELDAVIDGLQNGAVQSIDELKKDYRYDVSNRHSINSVVIDLVDSCFVSFEKMIDGN